MKSFRDELIDRMKTGWGRFVLASDNIENGETPESGRKTPISSETFNIENLQLQKKSIFIGIIQ